MFKKNLKLTAKIILKNKNLYFFNIFNLSLGLVCGIVILFFLQNFISFDKQHINHDRIYRVGYDFTTSSGRSMKEAVSSEKIGPMLKEECPEVEFFVRIRPMEQVAVKSDNHSFVETQLMYADTSFFRIFTHEFIAGNPHICLQKENAIVLTNRMAQKYFGDSDPMGKIVEVDTIPYEVTGVIADLPDNVHLKFDALVGFEPVGTQWFTTTCYTYLLLKKEARVEGIYDKYPLLFDKYMLEQSKRVKATIDIILEPLADIHFTSDLSQDFPQGNRTYAYIFGIVGLFVILISAINYINMSTAFAFNRTKEIGLKKIFGAKQKTLIGYFIFESVALTLMAFLISIVFVRFIIDANYLHQLFNAKLAFRFSENLNLLLMSFGLALFVGLLSGIYPAFYLSSIPVISSVSSSYKRKKDSVLYRKALIVFQFILSVSVLIGVLTMNKQINFINSKDLGFNKQNLMVIPVDKLDFSVISVLKEKLLENPQVISASTAYILPNTQELMCNFSVETASGFEEQLFNWLIVDPDYIKTMQMQIVEGRDFDENRASDANSAYMVNESFVKHMGWDHAVGKGMQIINGGYFKWPEGKIIGVVKDFNMSTLHDQVEPIVMVLLPGGYLHVRIDDDQFFKTVEDIGGVFKEVAPQIPFEYSFLDEKIIESYSTEVNQFKLIKLFSIICFMLSCLGLMGLSFYAIAQRAKEVAIRKQLGSSVIQIIWVLYKDIAYLILIAIIFAIPSSYWWINLWLETFAYRVEIGILIPVVSGIVALFIGFISVLYHSIKAAYINPVESLKYE
ncbi:MAG: ABC transporter permease [Bacteroidetes bacterium]|nr:ABC transporter permease [Bacteroidota bacterium]